MSEPLNTRTVPVNGEAIKRLRLKRGWTLADLAKHADCSLRTATNLEKGSNAYICTINSFAEAMKVDPSELMVGEKPPEQKPKERVWEIRIRQVEDFDSFDQVTDLQSLLLMLLKLVGGPELVPKRVERSSIEVTVEMTFHQIVKLIEAFKDGKLDFLNIDSIEAPRDFMAEDETWYTRKGRAIFGYNYKTGTRHGWAHAFPEFMQNAIAYQEMMTGQRVELNRDSQDDTE